MSPLFRAREDYEPTVRAAAEQLDVPPIVIEKGVLNFLEDRDLVKEVLLDIQEVTNRFFSTQGPAEVRPSDGFAHSAAFAKTSQVSAELEESYYNTMPELHFGETLPEWTSICSLVRENAELL